MNRPSGHKGNDRLGNNRLGANLTLNKNEKCHSMANETHAIKKFSLTQTMK